MSLPVKETRAFQSAEVRVKRDDSGKPSTIHGYAALFDTRSQMLRAGKTQFREVISKGAFSDALAAGQDVRALFNHDANQVLGRTKNGTLTLAEDEKGLRFEVRLNQDDADAMAVAAKIERGDVDGCSFGFTTAKDSWAKDGDENLRTIEKCAALFDVGPVTYPAYLDTTVDVRSIPVAEGRATMEYDDPSLVYACRCAVQYSRNAFDALQRVLDVVSSIEGALTPPDMEAAEDCVSSLVDLIAKARKAKASLQALGAEDETDDEADDDTPIQEAEVESNAKPPEGESRMAHLMRVQRMAEAGRMTLDEIRGK